MAQQGMVESAPSSILEVTAPTEAATALAFGYTAVLAHRPGNVAPLEEAGRLFGRIAHLIDAVEDRAADEKSGAWNPIIALGLDAARVRARCDDALLGIRLALREVEFVDDRLVHVLLVHELRAAVDRVFGTPGHPGAPTTPSDRPPSDQPAGWEAQPPPTRRNPALACLGWLVVCGTCQICCADEYTDPCTGERREGKRCSDRCDCDPGCPDCDCGCCDCDCCCDGYDCGC